MTSLAGQGVWVDSRVIPHIYNKNIDHSTGEITLGTDGKSVASDNAARRDLRYKLQATAKRLLPKEAVSQCMHRCGSGGVAINVSQSSGIASFDGVVTCKSVWVCPVCSAKISNGRRKELNEVLEWARTWGHQPVLLTLTARHGAADSLAGLLAAMKLAKKKFHQSREWRALDPNLVGHITATEVTHGVNGWHVHYHMILLVVAPSERIALEMCDLQSVWLRVLAHNSVGLSGNGHAFDAQGAGKAGDYVTKWGAAEEITLTGSKKSSGGGSTPFQLLATATDAGVSPGDQARAESLFIEYAKEFKGKRQLVWSRGLKRVLGIIDRTDDEIADEPEADDYQEVYRVDRHTWRLVVRRRLQAELLRVAEAGGSQAGLFIESWILALHNQERLKHG